MQKKMKLKKVKQILKNLLKNKKKKLRVKKMDLVVVKVLKLIMIWLKKFRFMLMNLCMD